MMKNNISHLVILTVLHISFNLVYHSVNIFLGLFLILFFYGNHTTDEPIECLICYLNL